MIVETPCERFNQLWNLDAHSLLSQVRKNMGGRFLQRRGLRTLRVPNRLSGSMATDGSLIAGSFNRFSSHWISRELSCEIEERVRTRPRS